MPVRLLPAVMPAWSWLRRYGRADFRGDAVAGLTGAAMLVPQGVAFAQLAGLPPEVGLYSATVPLVAYAWFGTSRHLGVGPVALISLLTASALASIVEEGRHDYVAAAALLALMVGAAHLLLAVARMGWVTNVLSHPVLVGFTAAAAVLIATSQMSTIAGVDTPRTSRLVDTVVEFGRASGGVHGLTLAIGVGSILGIVALRRWKRAFPSALLAVVAGVVVSAVADLGDRGVAVVGSVPGGLPGLAWPGADGSLFRQLLPAAITITLIGYAESIAVARVYARRSRDDLDPNRELVGLGAANLAAGMFSGQPVTGSFSRTAVNDAAGVRTPLASVFSAALVVIVLLVATGLFTELPRAVLAAVIIVSVAGLFDRREMQHIAKVKRTDLLTMTVAFFATLALGVEWGLAAAVLTSLGVVLARIMNPHSAELGRLPGSDVYRNIDRFPEAERFDGIAILRIDVSLNFANVAFVKRRLRQLENDHPEGLRAIVLDGAGINDLDASAESALSDLVAEMDERGVHLHLASMKGPVRDALARSGLSDRLEGRIHLTLPAAIDALADRPTP